MSGGAGEGAGGRAGSSARVLYSPVPADTTPAVLQKKRHIRFIKKIGRTNNMSLIFSYLPSQISHPDPATDQGGQLVTD